MVKSIHFYCVPEYSWCHKSSMIGCLRMPEIHSSFSYCCSTYPLSWKSQIANFQVSGTQTSKKILGPLQKPRYHKGDTKQVPYCGPTNIRHYHTKFSQPWTVHPLLQVLTRPYSFWTHFSTWHSSWLKTWAISLWTMSFNPCKKCGPPTNNNHTHGLPCMLNTS